MKKLFLVLSLALTAPMLVVGCTQAQAANTISSISAFLTTANTFAQYVQVAWGIVKTFLPAASVGAADAEFQREFAVYEDFSAGVSHSLAVARAANDPNPTVDFADVQAAGQALLDIVHKYSAPAKAVGFASGSLDRMVADLKAWR